MRFSSRLPASFSSNALAELQAQLQAAGQTVRDLTVSNPTSIGLLYPEAEIRAALGAPEVLDYKASARGSLPARQAVARHLGHGVRAEEILLTASTSEAYGWCFKLFCDPGDEVLAPSPSYPLFDWLSHLEGVRAQPVPAWWHDRWNLDLEALEECCGPRTRAILLVNPNNPTGQFVSRDEWAGLVALCTRNGLALVVDEVFADYPLEPGPHDLPTVLEDPDPSCTVIVLSGLSKVAALPQVKLGWAVVRGPEVARTLEALEFIADQYLSVSASAQAAAPALLALAPGIRTQIRSRLKKNLAALDQALGAHPRLGRLPVGGGWSVLLRRPATSTDEACALELLRETRHLVHPGHFFDLAGDSHLVLSLLTPESTFQDGLSTILPRL